MTALNGKTDLPPSLNMQAGQGRRLFPLVCLDYIPGPGMLRTAIYLAKATADADLFLNANPLHLDAPFFFGSIELNRWVGKR